MVPAQHGPLRDVGYGGLEVRVTDKDEGARSSSGATPGTPAQKACAI